MLDFYEFQQLLERELDHCCVLKHLLLTERKLVESNEIDKLPKVLQQKADVLSAIETSHNQVCSWLQLGNLPQTIESFIQSINDNTSVNFSHCNLNQDVAGQCVDTWQALQEEKRACNESNKVNGIVIAKSRKRNGEKLSILKGLSIGKNLYDASGREVGATGKGGSRLA